MPDTASTPGEFPPAGTATAHTSTPTALESATLIPTPTLPAALIELEGATLPPGFSLLTFATLYRPTAFTFDQDGFLYVTSVDGNVYRLADTNQDGRADVQTVFASGFTIPLGITVHPPTGDVYVSYQGGFLLPAT